MKTEKTYSVYVLIDPRTARVFYVGCSAQADYRLDQHLVGHHPSTSETVADLRELKKKPIMAIIHANRNKKWAKERETELITLLGENLVNRLENPWCGDAA